MSFIYKLSSVSSSSPLLRNALFQLKRMIISLRMTSSFVLIEQDCLSSRLSAKGSLLRITGMRGHFYLDTCLIENLSLVPALSKAGM